MITLKTDTALVDIDNWQEILDRVQFRKKIDPTEHKLEAIIGRYVEKDWVRCGLTSCNREHMKGYLVKTVHGLETNIGKDCGKTHFGVDFENLSRIFEQDLIAARNREILWNTRFRTEEIEELIGRLRSGEHGADWIQRNLQVLTTPNSGCPAAVVGAIRKMTKSGNSRIVLERVATEQEIRSLEVAQGRAVAKPHLIEDPKGDLKGMSAFRPENDLRSLLVLELDEKLKQFKTCDIDSLAKDQLKTWARWAGSIDVTIERAQTAVDIGRTLLTKDNLSPFLEILERKDDRIMLQSFIRSLGC